MIELKTTIYYESGRIGKVLTDLFSNYSRLQIQLRLKGRAVSVNGEPVEVGYKTKQGGEVTTPIPEPETLNAVPENILLIIVYGDGDIAVVDKPQGVVVHPSAGHTHGTMVNALVYHVRDLSTINEVIRPGVVHRIGKDTSGLLTIAENDWAHELLAKQLKDKAFLRKHIVLVHGEIPHEKGTTNALISRSRGDRKVQAIREDGKSAIAHFTILERFEGFTLVELKPETGRIHQIRVHMKYIGCSLTGDPVYGPKKTLKGNGQLLRAQMLSFTHPTTNEKMIFEAPLPEAFEKTLEKLRKNVAF